MWNAGTTALLTIQMSSSGITFTGTWKFIPHRIEKNILNWKGPTRIAESKQISFMLLHNFFLPVYFSGTTNCMIQKNTPINPSHLCKNTRWKWVHQNSSSPTPSASQLACSIAWLTQWGKTVVVIVLWPWTAHPHPLTYTHTLHILWQQDISDVPIWGNEQYWAEKHFFSNNHPSREVLTLNAKTNSSV